MRYKKGLIFICLIICLFSIASVCASDVNETVVASDDQNDGLIEIETQNKDTIITQNSLNDSSDINEVDETNTSSDKLFEIENNNDKKDGAGEMGNDNYAGEILSYASYKDSDFNVEIKEVYSGDTEIITVSLPSYNEYYQSHGEGFIFDVSAHAFHYRDSVEYNSSQMDVSITGNQAIIKIYHILGGSHSLFINYKERGNLLYHSNAFKFNVKKYNLTFSVDAPSVVNLFDEFDVNIQVNKDAYLNYISCDVYDADWSLNLDYFDGLSLNLINGTAKAHYKTKTMETMYISVEYEGDDKYNVGRCTIEVKVIPFKTEIISDNITGIFTETITLNPLVKVNRDSPYVYGDISIYYGLYKPKLLGKIGVIDNKYPFVYFQSYSLYNLNAGRHYITYCYSGDSHYAPVNKTIQIDISKISDGIVYSAWQRVFDDVLLIKYQLIFPKDYNYLGQMENYTFKIYDIQKNKLIKETDFYFYNAQEVTFTFTTFDLDYGKQYKLIFEYKGDKNHEKCTLINYFTFKKNIQPSEVTPDFDNDFRADNKSILVSLPQEAQGNLTLSIGNNNFNYDVVDGKSIINIPKISSGWYNYTLYYSGDNNHYSFTKSGHSMLILKSAEDVANINERISGKSTLIKLPNDISGNITVKIGNNKFDSEIINGFGNVDVSQLAIGDYEYTIYYSGDENYYPFIKSGKLSVLKQINNDEINIPILNDGQGNIKLPNDASGTISLNVNGKKYNFPVSNGVAIVKIPELSNGKYKYTITYSGDKKYSPFTKIGTLTINKILKTTLTLKTVKVKKSAKKIVLQATLKQGKKALSGKKIIFKFNGKKYTAKTNKKGIAKVIIKKKILKKLKVGKKVKYQASYGKITVKKSAKVKK